MSISIAIIGTDGIVLATDDRTTLSGGAIQKHRDGSQKLWILKDRYALMSVNMGHNPARFIISELTSTLDCPEKSFGNEISAAIKNVSNFEDLIRWCSFIMVYTCKPYSFNKEQLDLANSLSFGFTLSGYTSTGTKMIASLDSKQNFFPNLRNDYYIGGITSVGDYYIQKLWNHLFKNENGISVPLKNVDSLKKLAVLLIVETAKNNDCVSENVVMRVLTKERISSPIDEYDINRIKEEIGIIINDTRLINLLERSNSSTK